MVDDLSPSNNFPLSNDYPMNTKINTGPSKTVPSLSARSSSPNDRVTAMKQSPHNINEFDQDPITLVSPAPEQQRVSIQELAISTNSKFPPPAVQIEKALHPTAVQVDQAIPSEVQTNNNNDKPVGEASKPNADQQHVELMIQNELENKSQNNEVPEVSQANPNEEAVVVPGDID